MAESKVAVLASEKILDRSICFLFENQTKKSATYHRCWCSEHAKCAGICRVKQATYFFARINLK